VSPGTGCKFNFKSLKIMFFSKLRKAGAVKCVGGAVELQRDSAPAPALMLNMDVYLKIMTQNEPVYF
jgi:hypothetical protein